MTENTEKTTLEEQAGRPAKKAAVRRAPVARKKKATEQTEIPLDGTSQDATAVPKAKRVTKTAAAKTKISEPKSEPVSTEPPAPAVPEPVVENIAPIQPVEAPAVPIPAQEPAPAPTPAPISTPAAPTTASTAPVEPVRSQQPAHNHQPPQQHHQHPHHEQQPRPEPAPPVYGEGIIEVSGKGFGFLRDPKRNFVQSPQDIFVTPEVVRRFSLRDGMWLKGEIRRGNRGPQLFRLLEVNGDDPEKCRNLPTFDELTVVSPDKRITLETVPDRYTTRIMDMMTPIGKGQRGLIVAPPRTGKTTLLQHIADAVVKNHPEMKLVILLVDERPEEVTEIRRTVPSAEIMASSNDSDLKSHTRIAQLAIERARRLVEAGKHVFVLLDSITRVGRAFNNAMGGGGRTMSGGIDARALEIPRKLFAAARNTEEAGSLTIIATALIETGSRMDELIFQEFKGTGNMELVLDRKISDLRIYPAIDIFKSGTRREELLLPPEDLHKINVIRRGLSGHKPEEAIERLLSFVKRFPTNGVMLREIPG